MTATTIRDQSIALSRQNPAEALRIARSIDAPWFRCQAVAYAARYGPPEQMLITAKEAFDAAVADSDAYRVVGASAWPLRALVECGYAREATVELTRLLALAPRIENPISRMDALFLLYQSAFPLPDARNKVLEPLRQAYQIEKSWKAGWVAREVILLVAREDPEAARSMVASIPDPVYQRKTLRRLDEGNVGYLASFFHF